jgi:hypothetical protein
MLEVNNSLGGCETAPAHVPRQAVGDSAKQLRLYLARRRWNAQQLQRGCDAVIHLLLSPADVLGERV